MFAMEGKILSTKTIKPSFPTPQHLKTFKLSVWDEFLPRFYGVIIFFYQSDTKPIDDIISRFSQRSHCLQKSLSQVLIHYYPLAGRLIDDSTIDCNDEGAYFVEAQFHCQLSQFLSQPDVKLLDHIIPTNDPKLASAGCTMAIQVSLFNCGGMAISVCPSHKIADASSICTFVQSWAAMTSGYSKVVSPKFVESSASPPRSLLNMPQPDFPKEKEFVTKRFVFHASKIAILKANSTSGDTGQQKQQHLTNTDVVLGLIIKCVIAASRSLLRSSSSSRPSVLFHVVNMRKRVVPSLPENTIGNIIWHIPVVFTEKEVELNEYARKIRKSLMEFYNDMVSALKEKKEGIDYYVSTSLGKFPLYEMDFGWGKPLWVTSTGGPAKNLIALLDTKEGDGIEAWISLDEKVMAKFENDDELLAFASSNPSAFVNYCRL